MQQLNRAVMSRGVIHPAGTPRSDVPHIKDGDWWDGDPEPVTPADESTNQQQDGDAAEPTPNDEAEAEPEAATPAETRRAKRPTSKE